MARLVGDDAGIGRAVRAVDRDDPVLVYDLGSGVVAIVNTTDTDRVAFLSVGEQTVELPVGARHFSAWDYEHNRYGVVSGPGAVRVDRSQVMEVPDGVVVVFDDDTIEVRPRYGASGHRLTEAQINGEALEHKSDEACGFFAGSAALPLAVEVSTKPAVRCHADLERWVVLTPNGLERHASFVHRSSPDSARLIWSDSQPETDQLELEISWYERSARRQQLALRLPVHSQAGLAEIEFPSLVPPARIDIRLLAYNHSGQLVAAPRGELRLVFRHRDLPTIAYAIDGAVMIRILHAARYEQCAIVDVAAEAFTEGRWQPLKLNIGSSGQHARHLQASEEWQEVLP